MINKIQSRKLGVSHGIVLVLILFHGKNTNGIDESQFKEPEDSFEAGKYLARVVDVRNNVKNSKVLVPKCCPANYIVNENGSCSPLPDEVLSVDDFITRIEELVTSSSGADEFQVKEQFRHFFVRPDSSGIVCRNEKRKEYFLDTRPGSFEFHLLESSLQLSILVDQETWLTLESPDFCLDWRASGNITAQLCADDTCHPFLAEQGSLASSESGKFIADLENGGNIQGEAKFSSLSPTRSPSLCLRKCCPPSQAISLKNYSCVSYYHPWRLYPFSSSSGVPNKQQNGTLGNHVDHDFSESNPLPVKWLSGEPNCQEFYQVDADTYDSYYINPDGSLITEQNGSVAKTPAGEYCFDVVLPDSDAEEPSSASIKKEAKQLHSLSQLDSTVPNAGEGGEVHLEGNNVLPLSRQIALVCYEKNGNQKEDGKFNWRSVYALLTGISCIFLLITCLVYGILRNELNLPGWLQFAYAFSLLLTFSLLTIAQFWTQRIHDVSKNLCRALGYGLHFCFLSCFFWLTSMNLDLWLSFRRNALVRGFGKGRGKRRFFEFCTFSLGFPALITLALFVADSRTSVRGSSKDEGECLLASSKIGEASCVINIGQKVAQLHYFYGFVGVLLLVNLVIFVGTLISLRNRERETRMAKQQSTSSTDYDRLQLFTRLFLIMGILWIFEVISWMFEYFEVDEKFQQIFILTDCLNASQGFYVFLMFIWKKKIWKQLKKKCKAWFGIRGNRPLFRPSYNCTVSSGNTGTNGTSTKSSLLSSTKSTHSSRLTSTSTVTQLENECFNPASN